MNNAERRLAHALEALKSATEIVGRLERCGVSEGDIQAAYNAAYQARQAVRELDAVCDMLEVNLRMGRE